MDIVTSVTTSKNIQYEIGDKKAREEKLNISDLPSKLSYFENDIGVIDSTVSDLVNYYRKSETYTKEEIDAKLATRWTSKFVDELPTQDISTTTIYFVLRPSTEQESQDVYNEYIYTGQWELIGNTYVDLSDYYTKSETDNEIDSKVLVETQNRTLADITLQNNIDAVQLNLEANLNDTNSALNAETLAREQNNIRHDNSIATLTSDLSSETSRATNAESALSDRVDVAESHIADTSNPHNVTAEQVGLGNVTNVSTTGTITPNSENNITSGAVYTALDKKVDKVTGKGLSDENYTYAEKVKLSGLSNYDDTEIDSRITANENAITTLNGDSTVEGSVDKKIADALAEVTQIDFTIVSSLPETGVKGVIYFVRGTGTETEQQYDEYVWLGSSYEKLGKSTVEIDLSDVYSKAEVNALVSVKQDKITVEDDTSALTDSDSFDETSAGTNPTTTKRRLLSSLWAYIKGKISAVLGLTETTLATLNEKDNGLQSQIDGAISDISDKQNKTLDTALAIGGASRTTVETALGALNGVVPSTASASNQLVTESEADLLTIPISKFQIKSGDAVGYADLGATNATISSQSFSWLEVEYGRVDGFIDKYFISVAGGSSNPNYIRVVRLTNYGQTPTITLDTNKHIWMSMDTYVDIRVKAYGNFSISGASTRTAPTGTTIPINRIVTESDLAAMTGTAATTNTNTFTFDLPTLASGEAWEITVSAQTWDSSLGFVTKYVASRSDSNYIILNCGGTTTGFTASISSNTVTFVYNNTDDTIAYWRARYVKLG